MQDAAQLLHEAADEANDWESRMRCLSELSYALECEEGKYEVGALTGHAPEAQQDALMATCGGSGHVC